MYSMHDVGQIFFYGRAKFLIFAYSYQLSWITMMVGQVDGSSSKFPALLLQLALTTYSFDLARNLLAISTNVVMPHQHRWLYLIRRERDELAIIYSTSTGTRN